MKTKHLLIVCICGLLLPMASTAQTFNSVDIYTGVDSSNPYAFIEYNNLLYFSATDGVHGYELWVSDGTSGGTHMVKDIWAGSSSSYPAQFIVFNSKLYFTAADSLHSTELWVTDGTSAGTNMVADIWPGISGSGPENLAVFNNKLIFEANDSTHGYELWSSDGTTGGTALIVDIYPGITGSYPGFYSGFYQFNNHLYFNANDGTHGVELWVTDGTAGGTSLVADIAPGPGNSYAGYIQYGVANFVTINNKMLFQATDGVNGYQLWTSDGTTGGTVIVANVFHGGSAPGNYGGFIAYNGKAYYDATDSTHGYELWSSDGTASGTNLVKDAYPGTNSGYPEFFAVFNNKLYYNGTDTVGNYQLWSSDGTTAGTHAVTHLSYTGLTDAFNPYTLTPFNNQLFLVGDDAAQGWQFYSLNTADSLSLLQPPIATTISPLSYNGQLYPFNGSLAFAASFNSIGNELWFYTPVPAAIEQVQVLNGISVYPNPFTSQISLTGLQNGVEYHLTLTDIQGRELEQYQLTGTGATNTLNLPSTLASGMYLLQLSNGDAAETVKMVKE